MFRIRRAQHESLKAQALHDYVQGFCTWLSRNPEFAHSLSSPEARRVWVQATTQKALSYGLSAEAEVSQFLLLLLALGPDADQRIDWMGRVLTDEALVGAGKIRVLLRETRARRAVAGLLVLDCWKEAA